MPLLSTWLGDYDNAMGSCKEGVDASPDDVVGRIAKTVFAVPFIFIECFAGRDPNVCNAAARLIAIAILGALTASFDPVLVSEHN